MLQTAWRKSAEVVSNQPNKRSCKNTGDSPLPNLLAVLVSREIARRGVKFAHKFNSSSYYLIFKTKSCILFDIIGIEEDILLEKDL